MNNLLRMLEDMALNGYGIAWHNMFHEYRPFEVRALDSAIKWWHDPEGCGSVDFETAVRATYEEMLRQLGP